MYKFIVLSVVALVACVSGAPGGLVVPLVAAAPAVAVAHPVHLSSSYANTYRAPVVKAVPVVAAAPTHHVVHTSPVVATHVVAAHPIVKTTHQVVAHPSPAIVKATPLVAHAPIAVAHSPLVHHSPIAVAHAPLVHHSPITAVHGLPITSYANHYNAAAPLVKTHVITAPVTLVH